ncbi:uncharacterized protein [Thunnus thynnus]|uniref:uncharacterized protein n=1 Tax=Thunnus thynnus TaxID=8237 RepID=UPI003526E566
MKDFIVLLLFCHVASPGKHSLKYFFTTSSGVKNFPDYVAVGLVDEVPAGYYDIISKTVEGKQDWTQKMFEDDPQHMEWYTQRCLLHQYDDKAQIDILKQQLNQTEGVHIFQRMSSCEWDDETGEVNGFVQYGYDGEDFIAFDLKTLTWIALKPQAVITKHKWDRDRALSERSTYFITQQCPQFMKRYLDLGKSSLLRTELPSVSLLQKTPSSPVSCHATGFYPTRAMMFWWKDGEELYEDVEHEEILPNHDGSFQMSVDLNLSSVTPEDWRRYECVFYLSGAKNDIVTKLDKAVIRTNWGKHSLKFFVTTSSGVKNFPDFVGVGLVDEVQWGYCDSISVHIFQKMDGCEWDDETGEVNGFAQYGYDGEDFIAFDLKTLTWIAPKQQAVITKHKWDRDRALNERQNYFLTQQCPELVKRYLDYGKSSLLRTEFPSVFLLQKTPSSPVSCHATGFYPYRAKMFWRNDGEELHEDVEHGEILPNHDGSFQMSVDLNLSSVTPEDWRRYECVFHLSGAKNDIVTKLNKKVIRTNWGKTGILTLLCVVGLLLLLAVCITGVFIWRRRDNESNITLKCLSCEVTTEKQLPEHFHTSNIAKGFLT